MNALITGSYAYGMPTSESDVDLVIRVDFETKELLERLSGANTIDHTSIRFGKLNVIACTSDEEFAAWKFGTEAVKKIRYYTGKPVSKFDAKKALDQFRELLGIEDAY